jgi:putative phage-type endonuclease
MIRKLAQRSPAWLRWRQGGVCASDLPAILGVSPYATRDQVMAEKLGTAPKREETFAMRAGNRLEGEVLERLSQQTGIDFSPACVEHDDRPELRASLDGLDFWGEVVAEIKVPNPVDHSLALHGLLPVHYVPQVQFQLLVTGASLAYYASWSRSKKQFAESQRFAVVEVRPDAEEQAKLLDAADAFWSELCELRTLKPQQSLAGP